MKLLWYLFIAFTLVNCANKKTEANTFFVGAESHNINPATGAFIADDKNDRHFTGIHDSIFVKAMVVSNANNQIAILTFDCIGLLYPTLLDIRKGAALQIPSTSLNPANIVAASTHTHSGPDVVGIWGPNQTTSGAQKDYIDRLVKTTAVKIAEAWKNNQPAKIVYAETTHGDGWVFNISVPGELDRAVSILQFTGMDKKPIATLTNFACHPTFMDSKNDTVLADYVGGFYKKMNETTGGINLFLQGAVGGWVQPEGKEGNFENAASKGVGLADALLLTLRQSKPIKKNELHFRSKIFSIPVANPGFIHLSKLGVINRPITDGVKTEMAYFEIGGAQFITHPGETSPLYSLESKKIMNSNGPKFVVGLSMNAPGYILKPDFFDGTKKYAMLNTSQACQLAKMPGLQ